MKIAERQHIDADVFHNELVPGNQPVVIRSMVRDWPAVERCARSPGAACEYLGQLASEGPVNVIVAPREAQHGFFYKDDFSGVNFKRGQALLPVVLAQILSLAGDAEAESIAVQALLIRESLPGFVQQNCIRLLDSAIAPTMWIGNRGKVAPHFDEDKNLACVVAGRREFVLFPPEQIANLYIGPVLNTPSGVPISLVDVWNPDLDKFPRFAEALSQAQIATLEPGDAIFIPSLWWHGVRSLDSVNVLVNYWWAGRAGHQVSPHDSLQHAMLAIAGLDDVQRRAWRDYFEHYVFQTGADPAEHLPAEMNDIVTTLTPEQARYFRHMLAQRLMADR